MSEAKQKSTVKAALGAAAIGVVGIMAHQAPAATHVWTTTSTGTWSAGTWTGGLPVEGADTVVQFFASNSTAVGAAFTATNDVNTVGSASASNFELESLILSGTSTTARTVTINPSGGTNAFRFIGDANVINFESGSNLSYTIANNVSFINGLTIASSNGTLKTITGNISGTGGLVRNGAGRVEFTGTLGFSGGLLLDSSGRTDITGNNAFSGGITVNSGTIVLGHDNSLGTSAMAVNGGIFSNTGLFSSATPGTNSRDLTNNITVGGNFQVIQSNIQGGHYSFAGTMNLGGEVRTITTDNTITTNATTGNMVTFSNVISNGGLIKSGRGGMILSAPNSTYTGTTTVRQGQLTIANNAPAGGNGALGNATSAVELGDASTSADNTIRLLTNGAFTVGRDINVNAFNNGANGTTTIGGSGDFNTTFSGNIALSRSVLLTSSAVTGTNAVNFTGDITGNHAVSIVGTGRTRFTNAKTYGGPTGVDATATLDLDGSIDNSALTVNGVLTGDGSAASTTIAAGGTIRPGNSPGLFTVGGDLDIAGTYEWEFDNAGAVGAAGTNYDQIVMTNNAGVIATGGSLSVVLTSGDFTGAFWDAAHTWTVIDSANLLNNAAFGTVLSSAPIEEGAFASTVGTGPNAGDVLLTWTPVPEPTSLAFAGIACAGLLGRRRRM